MQCQNFFKLTNSNGLIDTKDFDLNKYNKTRETEVKCFARCSLRFACCSILFARCSTRNSEGNFCIKVDKNVLHINLKTKSLICE